MSKCKCKNPDLYHKGNEVWCYKCNKRVIAVRRTWTINPKTRIQENKKHYKRIKQISNWED